MDRSGHRSEVDERAYSGSVLASAPPSLLTRADEVDRPNPVIAWLGFGAAGAGLLIGFPDLFFKQGSASDILDSTLIITIPLILLGLLFYSPRSFETKSRNGRSLNGAIGFPLASLFLANMYRLQIDPWSPLIPAALFTLFAMSSALFTATGPRPPQNPTAFVILVTAFAAIASYKGTELADVHFDLSPGKAFAVSIIRKHKSHSRRSDNYYLDLPPWGPRSKPGPILVDAATYRQVVTGGDVCLRLHRGALGLPWFTSSACSAAN